MLACLMEETVCGIGMEKDSLSVALNNVTDGGGSVLVWGGKDG